MVKFRSLMEGHTIIHAANVEDGKRLAIANEPFDAAFLDHDLSDEHYSPDNWGDENRLKVTNRVPDGTDFAEWLIDNQTVMKENAMIVVHSLNPEGSRRMRNILRKDMKDRCSIFCISFLKINQTKTSEEFNETFVLDKDK